MPPPMPLRSLLNYIGIGILIVGLGIGEFIYWRSLQTGQGDDDGFSSPYDSRVYEQDVQRTIGTFGLLMDECSRALQEPRPLAITIAVVSAAMAGGCFLAASRLPPE